MNTSSIITTEATSPNLMKPLEGYEDWLYERGLTRNTIDQRLAQADRRAREWGHLNVSARQIVEWLDGHEGWTRITYYNGARSMFEYLVETGALGKNPMARMRRPPQPDPRPKPLTPAQLETALGNASGDLLAFLMLAYLAGFRAMEIAKIRGEHVTYTALEVTGKGGKSTAIPTHPGLWELAQRYPRTGFWFPAETSSGHVSGNAISSRVGRYLRSLGVEERGAIHRLRHSYCTRLARNGVHARVIQELMRHSSLVTTQMYIEVDDAAKRRAIETIGA